MHLYACFVISSCEQNIMSGTTFEVERYIIILYYVSINKSLFFRSNDKNETIKKKKHQIPTMDIYANYYGLPDHYYYRISLQ